MTAKVFASAMRSDERRVGLGRLKIRSRFQTSHILEPLERAERAQFFKNVIFNKGKQTTTKTLQHITINFIFDLQYVSFP